MLERSLAPGPRCHQRRGPPRPRRGPRVGEDAARAQGQGPPLARLLSDSEGPERHLLPLDRHRLPAATGGRGRHRQVAAHRAARRSRGPGKGDGRQRRRGVRGVAPRGCRAIQGARRGVWIPGAQARLVRDGREVRLRRQDWGWLQKERRSASDPAAVLSSTPIRSARSRRPTSTMPARRLPRSRPESQSRSSTASRSSARAGDVRAVNRRLGLRPFTAKRADPPRAGGRRGLR